MLTLTHSLAGLPLFALYFTVCSLLLVLFIALYIRVTPYPEIQLIREGNMAAAYSLSGAVIGFVLPLASAVTHSASLLDMLIWGLIALAVQILVYRIVQSLLPRLAHDIPEGKLAPGLVVGTLALATGILNAACMAG
jgi:putative membrane protein